MNDRRVAYMRGVLDGLVESLDATVRISSWTGTESVPEPLEQNAARLNERLGVANRLATDKFAGSPAVLAAITAMSGAISRLDVAFVAYRRTQAGSADQKTQGAHTLDQELAGVRADAHRWA
jgi:hypothetical protein